MLAIRSMLVATVLLSTVKLRAENPLSLEQIRAGVAADGRVQSDQLIQTKRWRTLHAFAWAIELKNRQTGEFVIASPSREFRSGEQFRLRIESATDLHIYVLVHNADGSDTLLLPEKAESVPLIRPGQVAYLPSRGTFDFTAPAGVEELRLLASPQPQPWVTAPELFQRKHGDELTEEQRDTMAQLRSIRSRSIDGATREQSRIERTEGLRASTPPFARG
ncbi:MAG: DUF4384 domain-containing protein [Pirellulaceae bacterium]